MPFYDYECTQCGFSFDEQRQVSERNTVRCQKCGSKTHIVINSVSVHLFEPYYDSQLGTSIKSPQHKKQVAKALGLTNIGDAKSHEVDQIALEHKLKKEKTETAKGPDQKFMDAWYKAKALHP